MSHNLTEVATRAQAVGVPDPGDPRTAASLYPGFQALANRVAYLEAQAYGAASVIVQVPLEAGVVDFGVGGNWQFADGFWQQTSVAAPAKLWIPLQLPPGVKLVQVGVNLSGNAVEGSGAHSALPATMPKLTLRRIVPGSVTTSALGTVIATANDPSVNAAAYDPAHTITLTGLTEVIEQLDRYVITIEGEFGANSLANRLAVFGLYASFTAP